MGTRDVEEAEEVLAERLGRRWRWVWLCRDRSLALGTSSRCREPERRVWPLDGEGDRERDELVWRRLCLPREVELSILSLEVEVDRAATCFVLGWVSDVAFFVFLRSSSPQWVTRTSVKGRSSLSTSVLAIRSSVSLPATKEPKTVCFPFRCGHSSSVMKNL